MEKQGPRHFVSTALVLLIPFLFEILVQSQDQSGFVSIDCGLPENETYADPITGINYVSDAAFIDTGISKEIRDKSNYILYNQQMQHLRSFPKGKRNCYTLNVTSAQKYIIRAHFYYGNYDNKNTIPEFDLYLGVAFWVTYSFTQSPSYSYREIIHVASTNRLRLCLVDIGKGTPFISAIELRPLPTAMYDDFSYFYSLTTLVRLDTGNRQGLTGRDDKDVIRYNKGDIYDRIWDPNYNDDYNPVETTMPFNNNAVTDYLPPSTVMMTAATPVDPNQPLKYLYPKQNTYSNSSIHMKGFYVCLYFAEVQKLAPNQSRVFYIDGSESPVTPTYLNTTKDCFYYEPPPANESQDDNGVYLVRDKNSTLPPLINAIEVFEDINILEYAQTQDEEEVGAMMNIKSVYKVTTENWQGYPCAPEAFIWDGVNCTLDTSSNTSSIISLNLSSLKLTGTISSYIAKLGSLQILDLSDNNLVGPIPDFLADMEFLKVIELSRNNLTGSVPIKLLQKSSNGSLSLSLYGNPHLCLQEVCNTSTKKKKLSPMIVGIAAGSLLIIFLATMAICWHLRSRRYRKLGPLEATSLRIRYSEIANITDNFKTIIGEGGFGKVYLGQLGGKEVAVKMLSASSFQGQKEFEAEAELLMRVHHTNLISLIGYCDEDNHLCLVYEYMALGNLGMHLSDEKENTLTWEQRLQIATDAAQGLDYLHRGCKPPMIHRDVKSSNILITEKFRGKVADFGLSRASPLAGGRETTVVAGTPGYLDPEYFTTNKLSEKSDVYSFGVVLMEIVTCRPIISKEGHIIKYINKMISTGDISGIIDPRFTGDVDVNSVWRVLELATNCVAQESTRRPNMIQVAIELEECLTSIRNSGGDQSHEIDSSVEMSSSNFSTDSGPEAR